MESSMIGKTKQKCVFPVSGGGGLVSLFFFFFFLILFILHYQQVWKSYLCTRMEVIFVFWMVAIKIQC